MKTKSKILLIIMIVATLLTLTTMVSADTVSMNLTSSSKLQEGTTVEIKVNLGSIDAGDGIDTITGKLEYDSNVFEALSSDNITAGSKWTPTYAPTTGKINVLKSEKTTSGETVVTLKLTVKGTINVDSTTVTLKDIVVSGGRVQDGGTGDIEVSNASVTLKRDAAPSTDDPTPSKAKPIQPVSTDSTKAVSSKLPQTGVSYNIVIAMAVVMVIGAVSFVRYTIVKRDLK